MTTIYSDLAAAVGNTPLIRLNAASRATGCEIFGKAEFMNPGQSVKDRAALYIIKAAVASGSLKPGGTIVEGTAGNTGIGLALVGASMGFRTVIVIPETQSQEKKDMLILAGAELVEVPAVPYKNPNNYVRYSGRLAIELAKTEPNGAIWANQFDNIANRQAHIETTGPEIWAQTEGKVDGFICAAGSGGTIAGIGMYLQPKGVKVALADPDGAALHSFYKLVLWPQLEVQLVKGLGKGALQKTWRVSSQTCLTISQMQMRCPTFLISCAMKALCWVAPLGLILLVQFEWLASWGLATK